mgnify:CR=1 FL=1
MASTRALMDAGLANEAATSQMEAAYYSVQTSILDLKEQINQVENSLALLLAETPRRYERGKLADQRLPEDVAVGVPMQMLSNRPDVRAAERSLEQAFLRDQPGSCRFLSFHRTEWKCRMDQLGREYDRQSRQIPGFGSRLTHTTVVQ